MNRTQIAMSAALTKRRWQLLALVLVATLVPNAAFAAKDVIHPSAANVTVEGAPVSVATGFAPGTDGQVTLDAPVFAGDEVAVATTWSVQDKSNSGTNTSYPRTVLFTSATTVTPDTAVTLSLTGGNCALASNSGTCATTLSFFAPATTGSYQLKLEADDSVTGSGSNVAIQGKSLFINITVVPAEANKADTTLTVAPQCFLLNGGDKNLTAILEETGTGAHVAGAPVSFYIDPELDEFGYPTASSSPLGSAATNGSGVATFSYNINGLGVGDHNLYGEFSGDANFNGSNDSATLGISYLFVGFQQPINPEGNSVFGNGRVIPIKIRLADANGQTVVDAAPTVWINQYSTATGLGEVIEPASSVSSADMGNVMRYSAADDHYIYNWDLSNLGNGTYAVVVDPGDSAACGQGPYYAVITVAKKGGKK